MCNHVEFGVGWFLVTTTATTTTTTTTRTTTTIPRATPAPGQSCADVTSQLSLELEKQMVQGFGSLNLWDANFWSGQVSLASMQIEDPFPGQRKILWIRFARAGDGERGNVVSTVSEWEGLLTPVEAKMEVSEDSTGNGLLRKEEFVSCLLSSPALSEPLRRLASPVYGRSAAAIDEGPSILQLDVTVDCPEVADHKRDAKKSTDSRSQLPVLFGGSSSAKSAGAALLTADIANSAAMYGDTHGVEVLLRDTIGDFLLKVQEACESLAAKNLRLGNAEAVELSRRYRLVQIGPEHIVLAFWIRQDAAEEHVEAFLGDHADPSNWRPLDKDLTFWDYASRLGFGQGGRRFPPCLRVVRGSELLRQQSRFYRQMLAEQSLAEEMRNLLAWAIYYHRGDANSPEWRLQQHPTNSPEWR
ncbi:unnamed protein product [Polarella glacialis]|uniref:Uncharacterized protein n=1 Tax=Polarella glacialis TaxID=89957 RepID=A0A813KRW0_POLGL|nr:unnamed protein product [Polarella glacialis]